ncbi:hypothetical protein LTR16_007178, partial [Cryomyces antarcticus]
ILHRRAIGDDIVVGLEAELDVMGAVQSEGQVEVRQRGGPVVRGMDGSVLYDGEGPYGVAGLRVRSDERCSAGEERGDGAEEGAHHGHEMARGVAGLEWGEGGSLQIYRVHLGAGWDAGMRSERLVNDVVCGAL